MLGGRFIAQQLNDAGPVGLHGAGDEIAQRCGDRCVSVTGGMLINQGGSAAAWPIRAISSPVAAASVLPVCRRSWKCRSGTPTASTAGRHTERRKFPRRNRPPFGPMNTSARRPGSENSARCCSRSGRITAGIRPRRRSQRLLEKSPVGGDAAGVWRWQCCSEDSLASGYLPKHAVAGSISMGWQ